MIDGNVLIPPSAQALKPGPFTITPVSCGTYTAAEASTLGTTAKGGFVYRFTNHSASLNGQPSLDVQFLNGSQVVAENTTGSGSDAGPGQSAEGGVDAVNSSGGPVKFSRCQLVSYAVQGESSGNTGDYAP